jgi:hypothetical protein
MVAFLGLSALVGLIGFLILGLMRRVVLLLEALEGRTGSQTHAGLPIGSRVPAFEVLDDGGRLLSSAQLLHEPVVVLLVSPGCSPCLDLAAELRDLGSPLPIPLIVIRDGHDQPHAFDGLGHQVLRDVSAFRAFANSATPFGYAVNADGTVAASGVTGTSEALVELAETLRRAVGAGHA